VTQLLHLSLALEDDAFVFTRIVSVCARRQCRIEELRFSARASQLDLMVSGRPRQIDQLPRWLESLVHVRAVSRHEDRQGATA
jgi:acetolactate synthase small subunit